MRTIRLSDRELEVLTWLDDTGGRRCLEFRDLDEARRLLARLHHRPGELGTLLRVARTCDPGSCVCRRARADLLELLAWQLLRRTIRLALLEPQRAPVLARDEPPERPRGRPIPPPFRPPRKGKEPLLKLSAEEAPEPFALELSAEEAPEPFALELSAEPEPEPELSHELEQPAP